MNNRKRVIVLVGVAGMLFLAAGCQSKSPMMLEGCFRQIEVGRSHTTEVLDVLPDTGILQTKGSISALNKKGWSREVGIVTFNPEEPVVLRKFYLQKRSRLITEQVYLYLQFDVPKELLAGPDETDMRKHIAILRYGHEALLKDARQFSEDQETESLIGLGRSAIAVGITQLDKRPREGHKLLEEDGFDFDHTTLNACQLKIEQTEANIFAISLRSKALVDPFVGW